MSCGNMGLEAKKRHSKLFARRSHVERVLETKQRPLGAKGQVGEGLGSESDGNN